MKTKQQSIFNLIEIFRSNKSSEVNTISHKTHCAENKHHDFYCDAEKPHIAHLEPFSTK